MPDPTLLRVLVLARHWQKFETFETQFRRAAHELAAAEGESWLASVTVSRRQFERWYAGQVKTGPHPDACRVLEHMFGYMIQDLLAPACEGQELRSKEARTRRSDSSEVESIEVVRQRLDDALSEGSMSEASLDDWERLVIRYGRASRDRPAPVLIHDLSGDIAELERALQRHRSASALRRLTRVAAHMSGLMCLTFCKLDDRPSFRKWARTARLGAKEAGDPVTLAWVLAQESYGYYYSGDLQEALDIARHARGLVKRIPCVGAALAAALEARIYAMMGRQGETREALARAEQLLSLLAEDELIPSAFAYNEAQLRFYEGNAYTHLRETKLAFRAQDRALELCGPDDYTDWALTRLDRATCLTYMSEIASGIIYATETLGALTYSQRQGIIALRGRDVLRVLPPGEQKRPEARELRDMLIELAKNKEIED
ncbi:MAG: hypothetical protein ACRDTC_20070 [Pseudonocardiaceae bacterium]